MASSHLRADCLLHRDQLRLQRSVTSMGELYLYPVVILFVVVINSGGNTSTISPVTSSSGACKSFSVDISCSRQENWPGSHDRGGRWSGRSQTAPFHDNRVDGSSQEHRRAAGRRRRRGVERTVSTIAPSQDCCGQRKYQYRNAKCRTAWAISMK